MLFMLFSNVLKAEDTRKLVKLSGKIAGKYPIQMVLNIKNNKEVYGYYFYEKYKSNIVLRGTVENGNIKLYEGDTDIRFTGFKGEISDFGIKGEWIQERYKKETRILSFDLKKNSEKVITKSEDSYSGLYGTYYSEGEEDLNIEYVGGDLYVFHISVGSPYCMGEILDLISIKSGKGEFSNKNCGKLIFKFSEKEVHITEEDCDYYHGARCSFRGDYPRRK